MKLLKSTASLGGEILGINLSQKLGKDQIQFLNQCWDDRLVLVFKKQDLDDNKLINFSKNFGELDPPAPNPYGIKFLPEFPEINVISNVKNNEGYSYWKFRRWRGCLARRHDVSKITSKSRNIICLGGS
jgi:taurine dioxygenase